MREPLLTVADALDPQAREVIGAGLACFNEEKAGIKDRRSLAVVALDSETKAVLGGLAGRTSLGLLFIDLFFLPESLRGGGLGSRILQLARG